MQKWLEDSVLFLMELIKISQHSSKTKRIVDINFTKEGKR
jgi:hypothetical protein